MSDESFPLSLSQAWLWERIAHFQNLGLSNEVYNRGVGLRLRGPLDAACLTDAAALVVARHPPFRTILTGPRETPRQRILQCGEPVECMDISAKSRHAEAAVKERVAQTSLRAWDLFARPPAEVLLFRLAADHHVLAWMTHEMAFDGPSKAILIKDLFAAYRANLAGRAWDPEPIEDYWAAKQAEHVRWSQAQAAQLVAERAAMLSGLRPLIELPTRTPRNELPGFRMRFCPLSIDTAGGLPAAARKSRVPVFVAVMAAWATAISDLSSRDEFCMWTYFDTRSTPSALRSIGHFLNPLHFLIRLPRRGDWTSTLAAVRESHADAMRFAHLPYQKLVESLEPQRRVGDPAALYFIGAPISMTPRRSLSAGLLPEVQIGRFGIEFRRDEFLLAQASDRAVWGMDCPQLHVSVTADGFIGGVVAYNECLFAQESIDAVVATFVRSCAELSAV